MTASIERELVDTRAQLALSRRSVTKATGVHEQATAASALCLGRAFVNRASFETAVHAWQLMDAIGLKSGLRRRSAATGILSRSFKCKSAKSCTAVVSAKSAPFTDVLTIVHSCLTHSCC